MKRILILLLMLCAWSQVNATTVAIVVENNTSRSTIGIDTLLGDALTSVLGYTVHYRDIDTVFTPSTWDGFGYAAVIFAGSEQTTPSPTANADSVAKSTTPMVAIGNAYWDEINLGTAAMTQSENAGYIINIGQNHWITKVLQDTVILWTVTSTGNYAISIPDTLHSVQVLLLDKDSRADTSAAMLAVCEEGVTVINTGDGRNTTNQRRAFFGSFQYQAVPMDSCQFYTIFFRTVAWVAGDTLNNGVGGQFCFSGKYEIVQSGVVENSSGTDSIEVYGLWPDLYTGIDYDQKRFFIKPSPLAVTRKLANVYRSVTLSALEIALTLKAKVWDITPPATYSSSVCLAPIIRYWRGQTKAFALFDSTFAYGCYTYRYGDNVNNVFVPYTWASGGASQDGVDCENDFIDTITTTEATTVGTRSYLSLETAVTGSRILDSSLFMGWVSNTVSVTNAGPGVEVGYHSVTTSSASQRPVITGHFSAWSHTDPMPTITFEFDSLTMASTVGTNPDAGVYNHNNVVSNGSGGALSCVSVTDDATWLSTTITGTDQTPFGVTAVIDVTGLSAGYHSALVTVQCDDADNSPATFKVALTLTAAAPAPSVEPRSGYRRNN